MLQNQPNQTQKGYRPNVAAVIVSHDYPFKSEIFLAQRVDIKGAWQFVQGGIDEGETPQEALFRELEEEIGTNEVEVIAECEEWFCYDFLKNCGKKSHKYRGQRQKYFLCRLKRHAKINLQTAHPEFNEFKFVDVSVVQKHITNFKKDVYGKALAYFKTRGLL